MIDRRKFLIAAAAAPLAGACARPALAMTPEIYAEGGIAIDGSDTVAYFEGRGPVAGSAAHSVDWKGATWQFANAANAEKFRADPEAFGPQYGGWCAWAVSRNYTAPTVPHAWSLVDGKLYLNFSRSVQARWSLNKSGNIARGDANWPTVLNA